MKRTLRRYWMPAFMMLFMMLFTATPVWANKGPNMGDLAFIDLFNPEVSANDSIKLWVSPKSSDPIGSIKGITYDKATNTLTLDNVKMPYATIQAYCMGDDFKVKVTGRNSLSRISVVGE